MLMASSRSLARRESTRTKLHAQVARDGGQAQDRAIGLAGEAEWEQWPAGTDPLRWEAD